MSAAFSVQSLNDKAHAKNCTRFEPLTQVGQERTLAHFSRQGHMFSTLTLRSYFVITLALLLALPPLLLIAGKAGTPEDVLAAREAVVRYQLTSSEFALADGVDTFCVEFIDTTAETRSDPPQELIQRLNDGRHKVRKGSDCDYNRGNDVVVVRGSNGPGLVLSVEGVTWKTDTSMAITGRYFRALCRSVWNLTSSTMPCNAIFKRHGRAQRIGRQMFELGHT